MKKLGYDHVPMFYVSWWVKLLLLFVKSESFLDRIQGESFTVTAKRLCGRVYIVSVRPAQEPEHRAFWENAEKFMEDK